MTIENAAIVGYGETEKSRARLERGEEYHSLEEYYQIAAKKALDDTGLEKNNIDGLGLINTVADIPHIWPGRLGEPLGFRDLDWVTAVDHGGASAVSLLIQSCLAVDAGKAETILCLGADMNLDPYRRSGQFSSDPRGFRKNFVDPFGIQGPNALAALFQNVYMDEYDLTVEQLGEIAVIQREHACLNPLAYMDDQIEISDYLEAEMIADPIRLLDCVVPCNGGFGFIITTRERANELEKDPVLLEGHGECHNPDLTPDPDPTTSGIKNASQQAMETMDNDLDDMDFAQIYDDYPIMVLLQLEDLGFCAKGKGGTFITDTDLSYEGELPLNTSGGQLSAGQTGMAGGFVQLLEGIRQLQREGGERQVPAAERGIVTGVGGLSYSKNLQLNSVAVLKRGETK